MFRLKRTFSNITRPLSPPSSSVVSTFDIVSTAQEKQRRGYGGVDEWKPKKVKEVFKPGSFLIQLSPQIDHFSSGFFTVNGSSVSMWNVSAIVKELQIVSRGAGHEKISAYELTHAIYKEFEDQNIAASTAENNRLVTMGATQCDAGMGGWYQFFLPESLRKELYANLTLSMVFPKSASKKTNKIVISFFKRGEERIKEYIVESGEESICLEASAHRPLKKT